MNWKLVLAIIYFKTFAYIAFGGKNGEMWAKEILDYKKLKNIRDLQENELEITIYANLKSIIVQSGTKELWSTNFAAVRKPDMDRLGRYASVDVLVIKRNSKHPTLMAVRRFMTGQPIESHKLVIFMKSLQKGHLGILIGTPDFLKNFHETDINFFENIGSRFLPMAGRNDNLIMIWETGNKPSPSGENKELIKPHKNIIRTEKYLNFLENFNIEEIGRPRPLKS
ncbi:hypothetical protein Avbf_00666 [Armadillidium vulgare]|nr:hypothetical protein Avbf_00666 [Armadillidium vulgare]